MNKTDEMVTKYLDGYEIVSPADVPLMYVPRRDGDPCPFVTPGDYENEDDRPRFSGDSVRAVATPFSANDDAFVAWLLKRYGLTWDVFQGGTDYFRKTLRKAFSVSQAADAGTPEPSGRPADATAGESV